MARRKTGLLDEIASLPWYVGMTLGIIVFVLARSLGGLRAPLAWLFLAACWLGAAVSFLNSHKRRQLLDTQTDLGSLARMNWREFEMLVGEAFRRRGYLVEQTGLGGRDGGIDLVVSKGGRKELVQCKQWRSRRVPASTVREMWGLVDHHCAAAVHIVCIGKFTPDAADFARGKPIDLVTGERLLELVREVQSAPMAPGAWKQGIEPSLPPTAPAEPTLPACPSCREAMVQRRNRQTGLAFWGCANYPRCRGTRPA